VDWDHTRPSHTLGGTGLQASLHFHTSAASDVTRSAFRLRQLTVVPIAYWFVITVSEIVLGVPATCLATVLLTRKTQ